MRAFLVVVVVLLPPLVAGCVSEPSSPARGTEGAVGQDFHFFPTTPLVINQTPDEGGFWFRHVTLDECRFDPIPRFSVRQWDRTGLVWEDVFTLDPGKREEMFWIPVRGEPPFALGGGPYACSRLWHAEALNLSDTFKPELSGMDINAAKRFSNMTIAIDPGSLGATATWAPDVRTWDMEAGFPAVLEGRLGLYANISVDYPDGTFYRWDTYGNGHDAFWEPTFFMPGNYQIRVNLTTPATQTIVIQYSWLLFQFQEDMCQFGFEWPMCSGS